MSQHPEAQLKHKSTRPVTPCCRSSSTHESRESSHEPDLPNHRLRLQSHVNTNWTWNRNSLQQFRS
eukprot:6128413-Alexandrium_andersonii.AAC.1